MPVKQIPRGNDRKKGKSKRCWGADESFTPTHDDGAVMNGAPGDSGWGGLVAVELFGGEGIAFVELDLVPVGVGEGLGAGCVQLGYLLGG